MSERTAIELNTGGSSLVEDPGIPLVGATQGRFPDYSGTDNSAYTFSNSVSEPNSSPSMTSLQRTDSQGSASKTYRKNPGASGWNLVTSGSAGRWDSISYRLSRRKDLIRKRRVVVDVACILALLGILAMLVEAELFLQGYITKRDPISIILKVVISISTVWLLVVIIAYHVSGIQLSMVDNGIEDWRLVTRAPFICFVALELMVCAIHPPPGRLAMLSSPTVESVLSILMFLRIYLAARFFVVHSRLVSNTATQSLGALNKVRIDAMFVFKALMSDMPGTLLICMMTAIFFLSSWSVRTCEAYMAVSTNQSVADVPGQILSDAMWMSAITFLTVGYGDVVPRSECGRVTAVVTGLLGVGTTALLVAVLAHKLEQSRAEKYVHTFVSRVALDKAHKHAAADVIKNVLKLWRLRRHQPGSGAGDVDGEHGGKKPQQLLQQQKQQLQKIVSKPRRRVHVHGKLLQAVREMREAKAAKAHIGESAVGVIEVNTAVAEVYQVAEAISEQQETLNTRGESMEARLTSIENTLDKIAKAVVR